MKKILITIFFLFTAQVIQAAGTKEYLLMSENKEAYKISESELKNADTAENNYNMCLVLYNLNDIKAARNYCNSALKLSDKEKHPEKELRSNILALTGNIYSNYYKNTSVTFDYYNQAKDIKENNKERDGFELAKLYQTIGLLYYQTGSKEIAEKYLSKALSENIEDRLKKELSDVQSYLYIGVINEDIESLKKALQISSGLSVYRNFRTEGIIYKKIAEYYAKSGKNKKYIGENYQKAQEAFGKYSEQNGLKSACDENTQINEYPYDIELNLKLAEVSIKKECEKNLQEMEGKRKNSVISLKGDYFYQPEERGIKDYTGFKTAEEYIERAINVNPDDGQIYLRAAEAYLKNYDKDNPEIKNEIIKYLKEGIEKAPCSKNIYLQAAKIYKTIGKTKEANRLIKLSKNYE